MGANRQYAVIDAAGKIDRRIFSEQAIYDDEMEKIFGRAWLMIGHESLELDQPRMSGIGDVPHLPDTCGLENNKDLITPVDRLRRRNLAHPPASGVLCTHRPYHERSVSWTGRHDN